MFFKYLHFLNLKQFCGEYKAWNTLHNFCPDFPLILQSEQVDVS